MVRATLAGRIAVHKDCEKAKEGFRVDRRPTGSNGANRVCRDYFRVAVIRKIGDMSQWRIQTWTSDQHVCTEDFPANTRTRA